MKFVVFEGLDGAGKSTLIEGLRAAIVKNGQSATVTREPGGSPLGDEIRNLLLRKTGDTPTPRAELLLYEAGRAQHVDKTIRPALERGEWVICDRYSASSLAFQAGGRQLHQEDIEWLNRFAVNGCEPDLWVLLDLTTAEAKRRMAGRELDRFETENESFHERVRAKYLEISRQEPAKWLVLDASRSKEALLEELFSDLRERRWL
jgi:dTMP kinase